MKITFSPMARYMLTNTLREAKGGPTDDARIIARFIIRKIRFSVEESEVFEIPMADGRVMVNIKKLNAVPDLDVDIDEKEAKKLINTIQNGNWGPDDDDWFEPLLEKLREVKS